MEEAYDRYWGTNSNSCLTVYKISLRFFGFLKRYFNSKNHDYSII